MNTEGEKFTEYKARITAAADKYLMVYTREVPKEERTLDTAGQFLKKHDGQFRKEVASIGVDMLHESGIGDEMKSIILEYNSWAIAKLFVEVMNASADKPFLETRI